MSYVHVNSMQFCMKNCQLHCTIFVHHSGQGLLQTGTVILLVCSLKCRALERSDNILRLAGPVFMCLSSQSVEWDYLQFNKLCPHCVIMFFIIIFRKLLNWTQRSHLFTTFSDDGMITICISLHGVLFFTMIYMYMYLFSFITKLT